jgi:aminopeptidase N
MELEETVVVSAQEEEEEEEEEKKKKNVLVASSLQSENGSNVVAVINQKPAAYNLDEIASNLHEAATKALEQTETVRNGATAQASIVEDVAHLVLDQNNNNNNNNDDASSSSRDYLVGVIQKVADYAEQAGQSKAAALNEGDDIVVTSTSPNHVDQSSTVSSISISKFFCSR